MARNADAQKAYLRAYYLAHHAPAWRGDPLPAALVQSALAGIPDNWHQADQFTPGPYLWCDACQQWSKIIALPHTCPTCARQFFTEEPHHG